MSDYGSQSMVAPLKRVMVRRPDAAFGSADPATWHYTARPELATAQAEHDRLVEILRLFGAEVIFHDAEMPEHADAIFVHDPALVTSRGAIILSMGKQGRRGEEEALRAALQSSGVPTLATLNGGARAEAGDLMWIDEATLAVGEGFRTNAEGMRQLSEALQPLGVRTVPVQLPYGDGPQACLHLMSFISMVDHDLAVVYPPLMPVPLWQLLEARGVSFVEVPEEEFATMGANVLALAPRVCVMLENNLVTRQRLESAGCRVQTYSGRELSLKAEGGATCLTRPILRAAKE
jgi:N-dimethylarginine dimethylaminohydrolase